MPGPGLALAMSPDVTATGDECHRDDNGEDGRKAGAEASPVQVDKGKAMVGLVQGDIGEFVIDLVGDRGLLRHGTREVGPAWWWR